MLLTYENKSESVSEGFALWSRQFENQFKNFIVKYDNPSINLIA